MFSREAYGAHDQARYAAHLVFIRAALDLASATATWPAALGQVN